MRLSRLQPKDFPVRDEDEKIVTADGHEVVKADDAKMAEEISKRLDTDEAAKEEDRWA